jgi:hypothetical protein
MNACESENYLSISRSSSASKGVEILAVNRKTHNTIALRKGQKDKERSTKQTKDRATGTQQKIGTCRVTLV